MSQEIIAYRFKENPVRTFRDDNGDPWFVAKDICDACGDTNYHRSLSRLDDDEKGVSKVSTPGGEQEMITINEAGMYRLLLKMQPRKNTFSERMEIVREFQRWVTHEVLPSIRNMGFYSKSPVAALDMIVQMAELQKQALLRVSNVENRLAEYEQKQSEIAAVLTPVKAVSPRLKISQIIRKAARDSGMEYKELWDRLYYEYKYRYSTDLNVLAKNRKKDRLDVAEEFGCIDTLLGVAHEIFQK